MHTGRKVWISPKVNNVFFLHDRGFGYFLLLFISGGGKSFYPMMRSQSFGKPVSLDYEVNHGFALFLYKFIIGIYMNV